MSNGPLRLLAGAGAGDDPIYVDDVFSTFLWTGDSSGSRSINNGIDLDGEGGLVWLKGRTQAYDHALYDTVRGATKEMYSNKTDLSSTNSNALTSFNSNGFSIGSGPIVNNNADTYVSWSFRKAENFFDVVAWSGTDGGGDKTLSHSLGSKPAVMIVKRYGGGGSDNWSFYHKDLFGGEIDGSGTGMYLNSTAAAFSMNNEVKSVSTTDFTVGTTHNGHSSYSYIAYLFAHNDGDGEYGEDGDEDIIKCGSYTGNGSSGQFINLGFEPQFLLIKSASTTHDWYLMDNMRGMGNADINTAHKRLYAQSAQAEESEAAYFRTEATGFHQTTAATGLNGSGNTYIYVAIRRPNKPASEFTADKMFKAQSLSAGEGADTFISTGFPVDMVWTRKKSGAGPFVPGTRLQGGQKSGGDLMFDVNNAEGTNSGMFFLDHSDGATVDFAGGHFNVSPAATDTDYIRYFFRRAKGYFDVVTYAGDGVGGRTVNHNLGVVPELYIVKRRSSTGSWYVYSSATGNQGALRINANSEVDSASSLWNSTSPTASVFSVSSNQNVNASSHSYVAYLFATANGISKVGSYTGNGSNQDIDCGFSNGASLVLIKRTDVAESWHIFDTARGIVAGNDGAFRLDATLAELSADGVDPYSAGFNVVQSSSYNNNVSGGSYIFLAIA